MTPNTDKPDFKALFAAEENHFGFVTGIKFWAIMFLIF